MKAPLLPKATAKWLIENTALSFSQIADYCQLHTLEIEAIANDEVAKGIVPFDPLTSKQVTKEDIVACEKNPDRKLTLLESAALAQARKTKGGRYTPVSKRQDKPNAIAWLVKHHPDMTDAAIVRLLGTTKPTIKAIREKTHWNIKNIHSTNPVDLGMCRQTELDAVVAKIIPKPTSS
ncbi:MAG: DUF1013 domain-containing protein [Alphaproteobacteria bacterium]|nr:MAG: DUF1013 domain-containing protein [Alphaproteobacteria bacterium]